MHLASVARLAKFHQMMIDLADELHMPEEILWVSAYGISEHSIRINKFANSVPPSKVGYIPHHAIDAYQPDLEHLDHYCKSTPKPWNTLKPTITLAHNPSLFYGLNTLDQTHLYDIPPHSNCVTLDLSQLSLKYECRLNHAVFDALYLKAMPDVRNLLVELLENGIYPFVQTSDLSIYSSADEPHRSRLMALVF
jgi:hypothetical protein